MKYVFMIIYHEVDGDPDCLFSTFLLSSSDNSAELYVNENLGVCDSVIDVTSSFSFQYDKVYKCLRSCFPHEDVEVLMNILECSKVFDINIK